MAAFGRRRRLPADLLQVLVLAEILPVDLPQAMVSAEILLVVVAAAAVGHRWFHLRSRQSC